MTLLLCIPLVLAALKGLALVEQRLHDLNLSAWDILIFLVAESVKMRLAILFQRLLKESSLKKLVTK